MVAHDESAPPVLFDSGVFKSMKSANDVFCTSHADCAVCPIKMLLRSGAHNKLVNQKKPRLWFPSELSFLAVKHALM